MMWGRPINSASQKLVRQLIQGSAIAVGLGLLLLAHPAAAATGINEQVNFQARLLNSAGATVADGNYNMRFKIYQDGDGVLGGGDETLKWTETRQNSASQGVTVTNGYFSVQLGSVTAFASNVDWNQNTLWLSIDIAGTGAGGSPTYDGEMTPFKRLSSTPYALNAGRLGGLAASAFAQLSPGSAQSGFLNVTGNITSGGAIQGSTATLTGASSLTLGTASSANGQIVVKNSTNAFTITVQGTASGGDKTLTLPNETGTLCSTGSVCAGYAAASGSSNYIQNGTSVQTANYAIQSASAGSIATLVRGAASQTADLAQYQASDATVVARLDPQGNFISAATTPVTAATTAVNATAGNLNGSYTYVVTFVTNSGETLAGPSSAAVAPANQKVDLTAIPTGPVGVKARNLYRTPAKGADNIATNWRFLTQITDNTTTTYTDNIADSGLTFTPPNPLIAATIAPQANQNTGSGNLSAGAYTYKITFVTAYGESAASPASNSVTLSASQKIDLKQVPAGASRYVTARRIYRTAAGGSTYKYLTTITDPTIDTYADNTADASLSAVTPPTDRNTSNRPAAPSAALAAADGDFLVAESANDLNYYWAYTWVNEAGGESALSPASNFLKPTNGNEKATVSGITAGPGGTVARRLYRASYVTNPAGVYPETTGPTVGPYLLSATIYDNTTTSYLDGSLPDRQLINTTPGQTGFVSAGLAVSQLKITALPDTPPLVVDSRTQVNNLNAELLGGNDQAQITGWTYNMSESLKTWHQALSGSRHSPVVANIIGDSITEGPSDGRAYPRLLQKSLQAKFGNGGSGFVAAYFAYPGPGYWVRSGGSTNFSSSGLSEIGPNGLGVQFCNGGSMTLSFEGTRLDLQYSKGPSWGTMTYNLDNGAVLGSINENAATASYGNRTTVSTTLADDVSHTITLTAPAGSGDCSLRSGTSSYAVHVDGIDATKDYGVRVNQLGHSGATAWSGLPYADTATGAFGGGTPANQLPQLYVFALGTNEFISSIFGILRPPAIFEKDMQDWINKTKRTALAESAGCLLITPPPQSVAAPGHSKQAYIDVLYRLARNNNCGLLDWDRMWNNSWDWANAQGLFTNDIVHPSIKGNEDLASKLFEVLGTGTATTGRLAVDNSLTQNGGSFSFVNLSPPVNFRVTAASGGTLTNGNTFRYKATALNSSGESLPSSEVQGTVDAGGALQLDWAPVSGAVKYRIYRCAATGCAADSEDRWFETVSYRFTDTGSISYTLSAVPTIDTSFGGATLQGTQSNALQVLNTSNSAVISIDTTDSPTNLVSNPGFEKDPTANLVVNNSFERDINGWALIVVGFNSVQKDTAQSKTGASSLRIQNGSSAGEGAKYSIQLTPSTQYQFSFALKQPTVLSTTGWLAAGYSYDGSSGNQADCTLNTTTVSPNWAYYRCFFTTSATTPSGTPYIYLKQTDTGTHLFYVDDVILEPVTAPTGWVAKGSTTFYKSPLEAYLGTSSLLVSTTATANDGVKYSAALAANTTYSFSIFAKLTAESAAMATLQIGRADDGSTDTSCATAQTIVAGGWNRITCVFTTGGTMTSPYVYIKQTNAVAHTWLVDAALLEATASTQTNKVTNGEFDVDTSGWAAKNGSTLTRSTTTSNYGASSLSVATAAATNDGAKYNVTLADNTQYSLSFFAKLNSGTFTDLAAGYASDGSTDTDCTLNSTTVVTTGFSRYSCTFTTAASHSGTPFIYIKQAAATARTFFVDTVTLELPFNGTFNAVKDGKVSFGGTVTSPLILQNATDSSTAFQVQSQNGDYSFTVDNVNKQSVFKSTNPTLDTFVSNETTQDARFTYFQLNRSAGTYANKWNFGIFPNSSDFTLFSAGTPGTCQFTCTFLSASATNKTVTVGTSDSTGTLLVVDTKTTAADPTGVNGAIYYNTGGTGGANSGAGSFAGKFRCFEGNLWKNCIGTPDVMSRRSGYWLPIGTAATVLTASQLLGPTVVSAAGTASAQAESFYINYATTTTSANAQGVQSSAFSNVQTRWLPKYSARVRVDGTAVTSVRYWVGLASATLTASDGTGQYIAARFSTNVGGETAWQCASSDGSTPSVTTTGVAVTAAHYYDIIIDLTTAGTLVCSVADNGGAYTSVSKTTNLPTTSTNLGLVDTVTTLTTAARNLGISYNYLEYQ